MSSSTTTTYYGLTQYVGTDKPAWTDNNEAFRSIDADLHSASVASTEAAEAIVGIRATVASLGETVVSIQNDLDTEKGKIVSLQNKETLQDAEIADVKADAQNMITAYVEATAESTHTYAIGDFFIYNDVLYKATSAITTGDTIVPDTNCTTTNVSAELIAIKSDLSNMSNDLVQSGDTYGQLLSRISAYIHGKDLDAKVVKVRRKIGSTSFEDYSLSALDSGGINLIALTSAGIYTIGVNQSAGTIAWQKVDVSVSPVTSTSIVSGTDSVSSGEAWYVIIK